MVGKKATTDRLFARNRYSRSNRAFAAARILILVLLCRGHLNAQDSIDRPLEVSGNVVHRWQADEVDFSLIKGDCVVVQGETHTVADSVLLAVDGPPDKIRTRVVMTGAKSLGTDKRRPRLYTLSSRTVPKISAPVFRGKPKDSEALLEHLPGDSETGDLQLVQFNEPLVTSPPVDPAPASRGSFFPIAGGTKTLEILSRNPSLPTQIEQVDRVEANESLIVARGGVTLMIRDVTAQMPSGELMELGTVSLSANRVVGWLPLMSRLFEGSADISQAQGELYLEGDIVFRQGERIIYAESMYYNAATEQGMILDAEAITTVPNYQGIVRLKSEVMQQVSAGNFVAFDAAVTSSRMGVPRYWLQSERLRLTDRQRLVNDPITGLPVIDQEPFVESNNNFVYFGGVPLLYWPTFSTSLERPAFYLSGIRVGNDNVFGTQVMLDWDLFQLFGIENAPAGVDWELSTDYLSDRGPALGTTLDYSVPSLYGYGGPAEGFFDAWVIQDSGLDDLGIDRRAVPPETSTRGRALLRHHQYLTIDQELIAEIGWISDYNFLEEYLENEWDQDVNHRTAIHYRHYRNSQMLQVSANVQVNDFFMKTEQLPQLDHYLLGGSLLGDRLTWNAHSRVGYNRLNPATVPTDPTQAAMTSTLPGEVAAKGIIASTRQELAIPIQLGPVRVVPSISGDASHYGQDVDGNDLTRLIGQAGVEATLPMWSVDPTVQSSLLNVRGLAHKVDWTAGYFYADSNTNFEQLPYYDALDDNAQEQFRRRFIGNTFGGVLPESFDPRSYALRHGLQRLVASPSEVVADDLEQFRAGIHQRWQTKRGLPGRERIVDLFQFDVDTILFPDADRDNFGETIGPTIYDARYHVGDRVSLLSDGYFDFFGDGLKSVSAGVRSSRPGVGDVYLGVLSLQGPISSLVFRGTVDYRMNEKWILSGSTVHDFDDAGGVGQSFGLTRIGESMLVRLGLNYDSGRDNFGVGFSIEPRFWPRPRLGRIGGQLIPPPGVEGLE